jgi:glycosyltransferase involved in cell wall biosynthesis
MIVAHLGPSLARIGGPAGYLWQLRDALENVSSSHTVLLPCAMTSTASPPAPRASMLDRIRRRVVRTLTGKPRFYRPPAAELHTRGGTVDRMLRDALNETGRAAAASLAQALDARADVLFAHDLATAVIALDRRERRQQVWLMLHSPMPLALYLTWVWGVPEEHWRTILEYPDVRAWTSRELEVCKRVDRLVLPCREAADDLARCDARFARLLARADIVPTGASRAGTTVTASRSAIRAKLRLPVDQPVGLFLGSLQPYRGFDALLAGLDRLSDPVAVPGTIAVAGPDAAAVPSHERVRALGRVDDVAALLQAVDFVVNVNRFSLFDLSLIEALEAGRPVLLHHSGGNRAFRALGAGCIPLADLEPATVAGGLERCFGLAVDEAARLGQQSRRCYDAHLTPAKFAARHIALYDRAARPRRARVTA